MRTQQFSLQSLLAIVLTIACLGNFDSSRSLGLAGQPKQANGGAAWVEPSNIDRILKLENVGRSVEPTPVIDDLAFLRRVTVDLVGRIPTEAEVHDFLSTAASQRRQLTIQRLMADHRFVDRWTVFFADMLRIRTNRTGGKQFLALMHQSLNEGKPYDVLVRELISAQGRVGQTPEVGFILADNADPMALAGATSQVFLGIRIACAECHDHPFDVWQRKQFYELAAYFGRTRRVESRLTNAIYTTEEDKTQILWPPEGMGEDDQRKPLTPQFPFALDQHDGPRRHLARLKAKRARLKQRQVAATSPEGPSVDDLLAEADRTLQKATSGQTFDALNVVEENARDKEKINIQQDLYKPSEYRQQLADLITDPRNKAFARNFVNRVWAELIGRGIVHPVDDFSDLNPPTHPKTLDYLAEEFIASNYDFRWLVRQIVSSQVYQRGHWQGDEAQRMEAEEAFVAAPLRRMLSEALYDSIILAGHLFEPKHPQGANLKTDWRYQRVAVRIAGSKNAPKLATITPVAEGSMRMPASLGGGQPEAMGSGYDLEKSLDLDFQKALMKQPEIELTSMQKMSNEEIEAMQVRQEANTRYLDRYVRVSFDDNPSFNTSYRMATPAPPEHFLRVFGQPARESLGDHRDESASMRQALMMLNGRMTNEAARVGELEPIHRFLSGKQPDLNQAISLAYRELLTREPSAAELVEAKEIIAAGTNTLEGVADLRWVLFNCHEFRFLP